MQQDSNELIHELVTLTEKLTVQAKAFKDLTAEQLNYREHAEQWSILQCLEHLNLYGDFYLPAIEKQILERHLPRTNSVFKSGLLGNYFANLMKTQNGNFRKMKSPKDKVPSPLGLTITTIDRFLKQQERLKALLHQAKTVDLIRIKVPISLTKFIQLRLGDTFRFFIYHIERHVVQAEKMKGIAISSQRTADSYA